MGDFPHIISRLFFCEKTKYDEDIFDYSTYLDFIGSFYKWRSGMNVEELCV